MALFYLPEKHKKSVRCALFSFALGLLSCPPAVHSIFPLAPSILALTPRFGGNIHLCLLGQLLRFLPFPLSPLAQKNALLLLTVWLTSAFFKALRKPKASGVGITVFSICAADLFFILLYERDPITLIILLCEGILNVCLCFFVGYFAARIRSRKKLEERGILAGYILFLFFLFSANPSGAYGQSIVRSLCLALLLLLCDYLPLRLFLFFGLCSGAAVTILQNQSIYYILVWTSGLLLLGLSQRKAKRWQLIGFWIGYTIPLAFTRQWWGQPEFWWEPILAMALYLSLPSLSVHKILSPYLVRQKGHPSPSASTLVAQYRKITDELNSLPTMQNTLFSPDLPLRDKLQNKLIQLGFTPLSVACSRDHSDGVTVDIAFQTNGQSVSRYVILGELEREIAKPLTILSFFTDGVRCVLKASHRCAYCLQSAALYRPKAGEKVCGDHAAAFHTDSKHYALLLSDGMGSGERAFCQSSLAVHLLQKLLRGGFSANESLELLHGALRLQNDSLCFTTVDLCQVALDTGDAVFTKAGAVSTYLLRGDRITELSAVSFPVGITEHTESATLHATLQAEDILLMISDGAWQNPDKLLPALRDCRDLSPRRMAGHLMEEIIKALPQNAQDDITVIVSKFIKNSV